MAYNPSQANAEDYNHSRHNHNLCRKDGFHVYKCSGCLQFGENIGFECRSCTGFVLHEYCAVLPDEYPHPNLPHQLFTFCRKTLVPHVVRHDCDACGMLLLGFLFESSAGLRLHPQCMVLPQEFRYSGHPHPGHNLQLVMHKEGKYKCTACHKENKKWKYKCNKVTCEVKLDISCAMVDMHRLYQQGFPQFQEPSKMKDAREKVGKVFKSVGPIVLSTLATAGLGEGADALFNRGVDKDGSDNEEEAGEEGGRQRI